MKVSLAAAVLLLLSCAVWFAIRGAGAERDPASSAGAAGEPSVADARELVHDVALEAPPDVPLEPPADAELEAPAGAQRVAATEEPQGPTLRLRVREEDGSAVPGATVRLIDYGMVDRAEVAAAAAALRVVTDPAELYRRFGSPARADTSGTAHLPWTGADAAVFAEEGDRFVMAGLAADAEAELELRLPPPSAVSAQVLGPDGEPAAGVPVALHVRTGDFGNDLLVVNSTAPDGEARFRGFRGMISLGPPDSELDFSVRLAIPASGTARRRFRAEDPPDHPLKLRMKPTAPVEVRVVGEAGGPLDVPATVTLRERGENDSPELTADLQQGVARFPLVGLRGAVEAVVVAPSRGARWTGELDAERAAGELAVLTVVARARPALLGRLVGADGAPVTTTGWTLAIRGDGGRVRQTAEIAPDAAGRFRAEVGEELAPGDRVRVLALRRQGRDGGQRADGPGELELQLGETHLGALIVRDAPMSIAGRCEDLSGEPVPVLLLSVKVDFLDAWFTTRSEPDGSFEIHSPYPFPDAAEVAISGQEWVLVEPVHAAPGQRDVLVRVTRGGSVRATLALEPGVEPARYALELFDAALLEPELRDRVRARFDAEGVAVATGMRAGAYRCRVSSGGLLLLELPDVRTALGIETVDPRLQGLRVADLVRTVALTVVDADGRPLDGSAAAYQGGRHVAGASVRGGAAELVLAADGETGVLMQADGYRYAWLEHVDAEQRVVLERGIPVLLRSPVRPALVDGERRASLTLHPLDLPPPLDPTALSVRLPAALAEKGEARVDLPCPGRYQLAISIAEPPGPDGAAVALFPDPAQRPDLPIIEVREEDADGAVRIELPADLFER
jgi:hypothetical protein